MHNKPIIRFARESDLPELVRLCQLHAQFEKSEYEPGGKEELLNNHLFGERPSLYCLVAEHNQKLMGYTSYMKQFSTWDANCYIYMDCLFLTEESRGFGIGERLIDQIKEEAKKMDCSLIQWQTPKFNRRAMKFYDRIGASSKTKERYFLTL
ncbi:GNAT family N-acetyltransferase [Sinomicrobium kalidii]|uniref:GNAT family N-acetyltransferase n=1 Tax=Sinomicrobium kalidii TaxID=2900738 RepID=UPI001E5963EC|nr:GNAT family N-acetyltransferase [Sinomicrobium kalidii]UGU15925.1 GNAT family N-acetyltransferase [Sinomicrobium kalidii]